jgi:hypothetical protein
VRIAHARARLLLGPLERELAGYRNTLDKLKELGSRGFPEADPEWKSVQSQLGRDLDDLLAAATALLQLRPTMT